MTRNPFRPGVGKTPPFMGRRGAVERVLDDVLTDLKKTDRGRHETDPEFLYLYGPRGNGKTIQLRHFENLARDAGIRTLTLAPGNLQSDDVLIDALAMRLCDTDKGFRKILQELPLKGELGLNLGMFKGSVGLREHNRADDLQTILQAANCPLLITLDEAHTDDVHPGTLKSLMDAVQIVGRTSHPTVLALAGTPSLTNRLRQTGASYWSRGHQLPIGRLDKTAAIDVVHEPLTEQTGFVVEMEAIKRLVAEANRYPYFLQLYGKEAFDAVQDGGRMTFGMVECEDAIHRALSVRNTYYKVRWMEFKDQGELALARAVALAFRAQDNRLDVMQMQTLLDGLDPERTKEREMFLQDTGYIWQQPDALIWEPGIPSLMAYMIDVVPGGSDADCTQLLIPGS